MNTVLVMIPTSLVLSAALWFWSAPADDSHDHGTVVSVEDCKREPLSLWLGRSCRADVEWADGERDPVLVERVTRLAKGDEVEDTTFGVVPAYAMDRPYLYLWGAAVSIGLVVAVGWWYLRRWNTQG
jgi:hypothetical protein